MAPNLTVYKVGGLKYHLKENLAEPQRILKAVVKNILRGVNSLNFGTKLSDVFHLAIPLNLSLFRAKSHVYVSHRMLRDTGASRQKF